LFPGDVAYVWHGERQLIGMAEQLASCGLEIRNLIVWAKQILIISRGHYHSQHESCWYAVRKGKTGHWAGDRKQSTLWEIQAKVGPAKGGEGDEMRTGHGTQKPVECMRRPVENNSRAGDCVYEPFSGSGTTIIAAEMTGRRCHAIEIAPQYVDVAVKRWQEFTGEQAVLDGDGRSFEEVSQARH
jgi:DNA modification methylase